MSMNKYDIATNLSHFLLQETGSVCGYWKGKLYAREQRKLFGFYIGRVTISICGETETLAHYKGGQSDPTFSEKWCNLD